MTPLGEAIEFDPDGGLGATGNNRNVDYLGFTTYMRPKQFLDLNPVTPRHEPTASFMRAHAQSGAKFAPPFLNVMWHKKQKRWHVQGHEGRNRAQVMHELQPDVEIPVHVFPRHPDQELRARHLTDEHVFAPIVPDSRRKTLGDPASKPFVPQRVRHMGEDKMRPMSEDAVNEALDHDEVARIVHDELPRAYAKARAAFGHVPEVPVQLSKRQNTRRLGHLSIKGGVPQYLRFSLGLLALDTEAGVRNTVGHEVAHVVSDHLHHERCACRHCTIDRIRGRRRPLHHGPQWVDTMQKMGYDHARTVDIDTSKLPNQMPFQCKCRTHYVGVKKGQNMLAKMEKHERNERGGARYSCAICHMHLSPGVHPKDQAADPSSMAEQRLLLEIAPFFADIEREAERNTNYRKVLFTTPRSQLVLMSLNPKEGIGFERHPNDQFFRIERGQAHVTINGATHTAHEGDAIVVPAGARHNVENASATAPLRFYTIYSPPHHPPGTVERTKADAERAVKAGLDEGDVVRAGARFGGHAQRLKRALTDKAVARDFAQVPTFDRFVATAYKDPEFETRGGWAQLKQWKADYAREHGDLMRYHVGGETGLIGRRHVPALRRIQRTYGVRVAVKPATSQVILSPKKLVGEARRSMRPARPPCSSPACASGRGGQRTKAAYSSKDGQPLCSACSQAWYAAHGETAKRCEGCMEFYLPERPACPKCGDTRLHEQLDGLAAARAATDTAPSEAQKRAGTYRKGKVRLHGMEITIENPKGSVRSGVDRDGKKWTSRMRHDYGYLNGTVGRDKDHLDAFIGPHHESELVHVIDQVDPRSGRYDEAKVIFGARNTDEARAIYLSNYEKGWKGLGDVTPMHVNDFKAWTKHHDTTRPIAGQRREPKDTFVSEALAAVMAGARPDAVLGEGEVIRPPTAWWQDPKPVQRVAGTAPVIPISKGVHGRTPAPKRREKPTPGRGEMMLRGIANQLQPPNEWDEV